MISDEPNILGNITHKLGKRPLGSPCLLRNREQPGAEEEILYFNQEIPFLYGYLLFYQKPYWLELARKRPDKVAFEKHVDMEKQQIDTFYHEHEELISYMMTEQTDRDAEMFTRKHKGTLPANELNLVVTRHMPAAALDAAKYYAYEMYLQHLSPPADPAGASISNGKRVEFDAPDAPVAEQLYGWYLTGAVKIDGRKAEINELAELWQGRGSRRNPTIFTGSSCTTSGANWTLPPFCAARLMGSTVIRRTRASELAPRNTPGIYQAIDSQTVSPGHLIGQDHYKEFFAVDFLALFHRISPASGETVEHFK